VLVFRRDEMVLTTLLLFLVPPASATSSNEPHAQDDGRELYRAACAACHGLDGRGQPLSRRQHIMVNAGVRIPLTNRAERDTQFLPYLLWDWFDGGLFDGWR
jgi:Cytochrome C oxidase, cbb3-type, subunit III